MSPRNVGRRLGLIIEFEPSWFGEFTSAVGILLWSLATVMGHEFRVEGTAWLLPTVGLIFGPARSLLLFRLFPLPRVLAALLGFVWWASLTWGMHATYGTVPTLGAFAALAVGDLLTVTKFSLAALRHHVTQGVEHV